MRKAINGTGTIEQLFESYKASYNEETPLTEGQQEELDALSCLLEELAPINNPEAYRKQQMYFDNAIAYARESEKAGFILGFKMAMNLVSECLG